MQEYYYFPNYIIPIIERLKKCDWLIHNFQLNSDEDIYNPMGFLSNENVDYVIYLDVNVYQYLLNTVKKSFAKEEFKNALSLVIFAQIADINFEPNLAIYEKINYINESEHLDEIIEDLNIFHTLNNYMNHNVFLEYIYSDLNLLNLEINNYVNKEELKKKLTEYETLKEWKSLYLMMLNICSINLENSLNNEEKLKIFYDWMVKKYRRSLVATVYAIVYFGKKPLKRMMKYKKTDCKNKRKNAILNMTWDLYLMNKFFRDWTNKTSDKEIIFASADKAFRDLLRIAIECQKEESINKLSIYLNDSSFNYINDENVEERVYLTNEWTIEYRNKLIQEFEIKLNL